MKLTALDGNSLLNRAFYGVRFLSARDGTPTNAVFGFLNILSRILDESAPDALCVCFDVHAPTFRHKKYAEYKAGRRPMPDELRSQFPLLKEVLVAMRVPAYELAGWEADDLLGTVSARCENAGWHCEIVTGDRDSLQLVSAGTHVKLVSSRAGKTQTQDFSPETFFDVYGFAPAQIVDLKALMGDASDNIKGVPGIGEKTAGALVRRFGSIDKIYANLEASDLSAAIKRKLAAGRESAFFSFDLATIRRNAPIEFAPEKNLRVEPDAPALYRIFKRLDFSKLIAKWKLSPPPSETPNAAETTAAPAENSIDDLPLFAAAATLVSAPSNALSSDAPAPSAENFAVAANAENFAADAESFEKILEQCVAAERVFIALEGAPYDAKNAAQTRAFPSFALAAGKLETVVSAEKFPSPEAYRAFLEKIFSGTVRKVTHDAKSAMRACLSAGLSTDGFVFDTALAAYLLDPTHEVAPLAGPPPDRAHKIENLFFEQVFALENAGLTQLFNEIELPLCALLAETEHVGIAVDIEKIRAFSAETDARAEALQREIFALAGTEFNLNSPKQLGEILFEKLALPVRKKTKTGYSTGAETLKKLAPCHPIVGKIIAFRQFARLKIIADGLADSVAADGRIHTTFNMTATATGRLSSSDPNLQNVPTRNELGNELRRMFVAARGNVLVDADYSQIELRVLAHVSGDAEMQAAFRRGEDIHAATACRIFHVAPDEVSPQMRRVAKAVNFGVVYGIGAFSLAQDLEIPRNEAKQYIENYFEKFAGVREYMKNVVEKAKIDGFVSTLSGRRRATPDLASANHNVRAFGERVALNTPIQGTAADIMKIAMLRVRARLKKDVPAAKIVLQVHDELLVETPAESAEIVKKALSEEMESAFPLDVPLVADAAAGENWAEAK